MLKDKGSSWGGFMSLAFSYATKAFEVDGFKFTLRVSRITGRIHGIYILDSSGGYLAQATKLVVDLINKAIKNGETADNFFQSNIKKEEGILGKIIKEIFTFLWEQSPTKK